MGEVETDDNDRPVDGITLKTVEVLLNPFDDVVPRISQKIEEVVEEKKPKPKGTKNLTLLSFGEEEASEAPQQRMKPAPSQKQEKPLRPMLEQAESSSSDEEEDRLRGAVKSAVARGGTQNARQFEKKGPTGAAGFAADVRRVHANAALYCEPSPNADDVVVYRMAQVLRAAFEHKWRQVLEANIGRETEAGATFAAADEEVRKEAGDDDVMELQHVKPHAGDPEALVDKRVEVHWPRDKVWYAGVVTEYRAKDGRHRVDYDDGHSEWLDLNRPQTVYRIVGSSTFSDNKPQQDDSLLSVQKLGVLVWAKSGAHPWWPGELCLPAATKFMEALPPPRPGARMPRQRMVIYFGENQFDILPENAVVPLGSRPEPRGKGTADLVKAYELALERELVGLDEVGRALAAGLGPRPERHDGVLR